MKHLVAFVFTIFALVLGAYLSTPSSESMYDVRSSQVSDQAVADGSSETESSQVKKIGDDLEVRIPEHEFIERAEEGELVENEDNDVYEVKDLASEIAFDDSVTERDLAYVEIDLTGEELKEALNEGEEPVVEPQDLVDDMYYADLKEAEDYNYQLNGDKHVEWSQEELEMLEMGEANN